MVAGTMAHLVRVIYKSRKQKRLEEYWTLFKKAHGGKGRAQTNGKAREESIASIQRFYISTEDVYESTQTVTSITLTSGQ